MATQKVIKSDVATAAAELVACTAVLDNARIALALAEREYTAACESFDKQVAETRNTCSR